MGCFTQDFQTPKTSSRNAIQPRSKLQRTLSDLQWTHTQQLIPKRGWTPNKCLPKRPNCFPPQIGPRHSVQHHRRLLLPGLEALPIADPPEHDSRDSRCDFPRLRILHSQFELANLFVRYDCGRTQASRGPANSVHAWDILQRVTRLTLRDTISKRFQVSVLID